MKQQKSRIQQWNREKPRKDHESLNEKSESQGMTMLSQWRVKAENIPVPTI
jgi:hypothetical protein